MIENPISAVVLFIFLIFGILVGFAIGNIVHFDIFNEKEITIAFITAIPAIALVVVTFYYAIRTNRLVKVQTDPMLNIYIESKFSSAGIIIYLVVKNVGNSPAYNISFVPTPDNYEYEVGKKIKDLELIKKGIMYLNPQQERKFEVSSQHKLKSQEEYCNLEVKYSDSLNVQHHSSSYIKFTEYHHTYTNEQLVSELSKINGTLDIMITAITTPRRSPFGND